MNPSIKEILTEWLKANGYDGLCSRHGCGCGLDDLMPCWDECSADCRAAYQVPASEEYKEEYGDDCEYMFALKKGERKPRKLKARR